VTEWSPQQEDALASVAAWLRSRDKQVFRLFGYAGTGKTTLARHLAEDAGLVAFAAFTGKAASVMRRKGCADAATIHSLIYRPEEDSHGRIRFVLNREGPASEADLIVIDECSMVDEMLGRDLLSFERPILVLGDPAQLPPVNGTGFFTSAAPDVLLTEVHRQARESPIIRLSMDVREGRRIVPASEGAVRLLPRSAIEAKDVLEADQVLVGLNRTRRTYNGRIRSLLGYEDPFPQVRDRLVCLRNRHQKGLLNGTLWTVDGPLKASNDDRRAFAVSPQEGEPGRPVSIEVHRSVFDGSEAELTPEQRRGLDEFDYGYALTVHKAQGSQWSKVLVFDESGVFRADRRRWLYTAITRAAESLTIVTEEAA
jgi:exodeoxyribonuclease-5